MYRNYSSIKGEADTAKPMEPEVVVSRPNDRVEQAIKLLSNC